MKLRNKLILSCAALAAVATTAVSTTFAWYTSNTKVQAKNVEGSSAAAGNDMLLIANGLKSTTDDDNVTTISAITDYTELVFTSEIEVVAEYVGTGLVNGKLMPAGYDGGYLQSQNSALELDDEGKKKNAGSAATEDAASYLHFVLYMKNQGTHDGTVTMKITDLTNETASLPVFPVLGTQTQNLAQYINSSWTSYSEGRTYTIDIRRALAMDYELSQTKSATNLALDDAADKIGTIETVKDISTAATISSGTDSYAGGNALTYYNGVVEEGNRFPADKAPSPLSTYTAATGETGLAIAASEAKLTKIDFKIFLNGWSAACFDACQGQDFKFNLKFEFVKSAPQNQNNG